MPTPENSQRPKTLRSLADLVAAGLVAPDAAGPLAAVADRYAVAVTPAMARLIAPDDPRDPIARQFLPLIDELSPAPHERDESADSQAGQEPSGQRIGKQAQTDLERGLVDTDKGPALGQAYDKVVGHRK